MKKEERSFGILMHISSLPSNHGIGTFGQEAYKFADFLSSIKAKYWQILPLNVTSYGDSPYQSFSSTGLNYYFIDLDMLVEDKLLKKEEIKDKELYIDDNRVDYSLLFNNRIKLLKKAFSRFNLKDKDFIFFVNKKKYHDFAFFMCLKELNNFKPWYEFDKEYRKYSKELEKGVISKNNELYMFYLFTQFIFLKQYTKLKNYVNKLGIKIIGDMPIYVAYDSIEAYKYPELFLFDEEQVPTLVAGCPPDEFTSDGQLWGNPIYNYEKMKEDNYTWFRNRINDLLSVFDVLRIDHFRGFAGYYAIPYGMPNARIGKWIDGPGIELFKPLLNKPIIAEDLGFKDDKVVQLLNETNYPAMKVLEFAFTSPENEFNPENIGYNFIAYTGTHDNETLVGYLSKMKKDDKKKFVDGIKHSLDLFKIKTTLNSDNEIANSIIELTLASKARSAIIPIQDILGLDNTARMNVPSKLNGVNWTFRITKKSIDSALINKYKKLIIKYKRD